MAEGQRYIATVDVDTEREDLGVQKIAFTSNPAIIIKGVAFAAEQPNANQYKDNKKMRIAAPVLIPTEIYRKAEGGHTLIFTAEEIAGIQQDFMKRLNNQNPLFKLEHTDPGSSPAYILETWVVEDEKTDKANTVYGLGVTAGSWVVVIQVTDRSYYDKVVADGATGLSIEGFLGHKLELSGEDDVTNKDEKMAGEADVVKVALPDGTYTGEDGKKFKVVDGVVVAPEEMSDEEKEAAAKKDGEEVEMTDEELEDGTMISFEGELKVGAKTSAKDGEHKTKAGKVVVVKDGTITEIKDAVVAELEDEATTTATPVTTYTKEEVDKMFEDLRAEFVDKLAEYEIKLEKPAGETEGGKEVAMSKEERNLSRLEAIREALRK